MSTEFVKGSEISFNTLCYPQHEVSATAARVA
jgi:hypothetical protein